MKDNFHPPTLSMGLRQLSPTLLAFAWNGPTIASSFHYSYSLFLIILVDTNTYRISSKSRRGEISRAATSPLTRLAPIFLHSAYFESDDPFPCGEISRTAFIGTNLLIGASRFRGNTVFYSLPPAGSGLRRILRSVWWLDCWDHAWTASIIILYSRASSLSTRAACTHNIIASELHAHNITGADEYHWRPSTITNQFKLQRARAHPGRSCDSVNRLYSFVGSPAASLARAPKRRRLK